MAIGVYRGTTKIAANKIFRGTTPIVSVWRGTTKIWPSEVLLYEDLAPAQNDPDWYDFNSVVTQEVNGLKFAHHVATSSWYTQLPFTSVVGKLITVRMTIGGLAQGGNVFPNNIKIQGRSGGSYISGVDAALGINEFTYMPTSTSCEIQVFQGGNPAVGAQITMTSLRITREA